MDDRHPSARPGSPLACRACDGWGGQQVTVFFGRGPNECYPDDEDCGACGALGYLPDEITARHVEALIEDEVRTEDAWLAEADAAEARWLAEEQAS